MKSTRELALAATLLTAFAGCGGQSIVGGGGSPVDGGASDLGSTDGALSDGGQDDASTDAADAVIADTGPARCVSSADCAGNPMGAVCNTETGQCVGCVASNDTCEAGNYCDPMTGMCVRGCRDDNACASTPDADGGVGPQLRCNPTTRNCVQCVTDMHCPAGTLCRGNECVVGCMDDTRCAMGETCCNGGCVNTQNNTDNCGACGTQCMVPNAQAACAAGQCAVGTCTGDRRDCNSDVTDGCETDTNSSLEHCGGCGRLCNSPPNAAGACTAGVCTFTCATGFADCDNDPSNGCEVDLNASNDHCGACGAACAPANATGACMMGQCAVAACTMGFGDCDGLVSNGCEANVQTSTTHCGTCGTMCPTPSNGEAACAMGTCGISTCGSGFADCDGDAMSGCEVNTQTSTAHCGACGNACELPNATAACTAGACAVGSCATGFADCDNDPSNGCEVNTQTSTANCGACGNACATTNGSAACAAGSCATGGCNTGFADCDGDPANGCEVNTQTNAGNCGACGTVCNLANATAVCGAGTCAVGTCNAGFADCDGNPANGCEVNLNTTASSCGACGRACAAPNGVAVCSAGACAVGACNAGFADCDGNPANGCEVVIASDTGNCGACRNVCPTPSNGSAVCSSGVCGIGSCSSGTANCDGNVSNGCEVNTNTSLSNCGACGRACATPANGAPACTGGVCGLGTCNAGFANCDNNAGNGCETNLNTNVSSCGACGRACSFANATATCSGGACALGACNAGFANCDGNPANGCETNLALVSSCGRCGNVCTAPTGGTVSCTAGSCVQSCPAGQTNCGGVCRATGASCTSAGTGGCANTGTVVCSGTTTTCSAAPRTSGSCTSPAGGVCTTGGTCACATGQTNCSGTCRAVATDTNNCGACGRVCTAPTGGTVSCTAGSCVQSCPAGQTNCGGVCRATGATCTSAGTGGCANTGTLVCSGTTTVCSATPRTSGPCSSPAGGTCTTGGTCTCGTGFTNCSGTCRNLQTENANCGACGRACSTGSTCVSGVCVGQGSLRFTLTWDTNGDMDLHVLPPCGTEIYYGRTSACGGTLDVDNTSSRGPENIFWSGSYTPGRYYVCAEAFSSTVSRANYVLTVVRNGVTVRTVTGNRGGVTDGNRACGPGFNQLTIDL
ncbi:MAG: hypothetical protein R3A48_04845 [Polyangiales bacterium]